MPRPPGPRSGAAQAAQHLPLIPPGLQLERGAGFWGFQGRRQAQLRGDHDPTCQPGGRASAGGPGRFLVKVCPRAQDPHVRSRTLQQGCGHPLPGGGRDAGHGTRVAPPRQDPGPPVSSSPRSLSSDGDRNQRPDCSDALAPRPQHAHLPEGVQRLSGRLPASVSKPTGHANKPLGGTTPSGPLGHEGHGSCQHRRVLSKTPDHRASEGGWTVSVAGVSRPQGSGAMTSPSLRRGPTGPGNGGGNTYTCPHVLAHVHTDAVTFPRGHTLPPPSSPVLGPPRPSSHSHTDTRTHRLPATTHTSHPLTGTHLLHQETCPHTCFLKHVLTVRGADTSGTSNGYEHTGTSAP